MESKTLKVNIKLADKTFEIEFLYNEEQTVENFKEIVAA